MSKAKAPDGAFSVGQHQPAITGQGPQVLDASPVRIARMLRKIAQHEAVIRAWEDMSRAPGRRFALVDGEVKLVKASELVGDSIKTSKAARDKHLADLRHVIDYHLTTVAYEDVPCPTCRLPEDAAAFLDALPQFESPAIQCTTCLGRLVVRSKRKDEKSINDAKLVRYWSKVLDDYVRCAKIKAGTSEADQAYEELESANRGLLLKFGSEKQTSLEGDDALQGVRQGIIDAAVRFNPLKRKKGKYCCAVFNTVAYNWCRRNSRARHQGQKRAGVYAPSIETLGKKYNDGEGGGGAAMVTSSEGALGTLHPCSAAQPSLILDMREKIDALPEMQRMVVSCEMAGMSTSQISERLEITRVAVRKHRSAAFETLREDMSSYVSALHD